MLIILLTSNTFDINTLGWINVSNTFVGSRRSQPHDTEVPSRGDPNSRLGCRTTFAPALCNIRCASIHLTVHHLRAPTHCNPNTPPLTQLPPSAVTQVPGAKGCRWTRQQDNALILMTRWCRTLDTDSTW